MAEPPIDNGRSKRVCGVSPIYSFSLVFQAHLAAGQQFADQLL
ncbi:hypothetical protein [Brevibacillus sp. SKDU10]|nr:hypothetical protein [Brevibacillus sp. SKDU10]